MPAISIAQSMGSLFPELSDRDRDSAASPSRQSAREAEWRTALARAYAYQYGRARSPEDVQALDAEYERMLAAPPDFRGYRRKSQFGAAPRVTADRNALARIKFKLQALRRGTWSVKTKGKHSGGIPHSVMEVFDALAHLATKHGKVFPSLVGLGILATRSKQTVVNAIKVLEFYGIVTRVRRIKRVKTLLGFKTVQDTNAYTIQSPNVFGEAAYQLFQERSESRNRAAREPESYSSRERERISATPPPDRQSWRGLKHQWEAT